MKPLPDSLVQRQALERAAALYRAEGVSFVNAMLDLVGPAGWADVTVPEIADQAGIHPRTATRWLVRCERDGVLRWLRRVGRGARSRLCLVPLSARVCCFLARA